MTPKSALAYLAAATVILGGLAITNKQGWERDQRRQLEREQSSTRHAEFAERAAGGPDVLCLRGDRAMCSL